MDDMELGEIVYEIEMDDDDSEYLDIDNMH
jgi:hypothetical protein